MMEHEPIDRVMQRSEEKGACGEAPWEGAHGQVLKEGKHVIFQIMIIPVDLYCYIKCRINWNLDF